MIIPSSRDMAGAVLAFHANKKMGGTTGNDGQETEPMDSHRIAKEAAAKGVIHAIATHDHGALADALEAFHDICANGPDDDAQ